LARAGAFVFPAQSSGSNKKQPCKGVYWRSVSTRDEAKLRDLWRRHPEAVPAIDLAKSGWLVIDCDKKPSDGLAWLTEHAAQHGDPLEAPPAVDTPSGGRHLYYKNTFAPPHGNARGQLPPKKECGIDVRGAGGFVVGPGAVFTDGSGGYTGHGSIFDAGQPPSWLVRLLSPPVGRPIVFTAPPASVSDVRLAAYGETALAEELSTLAAAAPGTRNEAANMTAFRVGQLVGGGCLTYSAAYSALEQAVLSWGVRPNDKALGTKGTLARALHAGEGKPRGPGEDLTPTVEIHLLDGERFDPETGELPSRLSAASPPAMLPAEQPDELPDHLTRIPGLVGQLTDFITDTALYPQRGLSLGAALTIVGTAAGRHIAGPTRSGTHLYVVCLAPSGTGKDHPLTMIAPILASADMRPHIGPSQFISMPAVINFLCRAPLSVCAMDEFGSFLKRINSRKASGFEGAISGMLRTAWGCSFKAMATPEWAQRSSEMIFSPALSIFGAVTAGDFYSSLEGGDVTNGVLNRFLVIETKTEPAERVPLRDAAEIPGSISAALKKIYHRNPLAQLCQSTISPAYDRLAIHPDAEKIRRDLVLEIRQRGQADRTLAPFLARTAENAIRLATILAVGQFQPEIDAATMAWARQFALWSTETLARGAGLYIADSDTQAAANAVRRAIQERGGRIRRRDLLRVLAHRYKTRELEDVIKSLAEAEDIVIEKITSADGGRPAFFYKIPTFYAS
jgi:hypothetical protein